MFSSEGFEMIESVTCFLFQFVDVFGPGHIVLESDAEMMLLY